MWKNNIRNNCFDLIRLLAALQIMLGHSWRYCVGRYPWYLSPLFDLSIGVTVFFITSGYLVFASYENNRDNPGKYFFNRIIRIYPPIWISNFLLLLAGFPSFSKTIPDISGVYHHYTSLGDLCGRLIIENIVPGVHVVGIVNGSLWTIKVELQIYILIALLYKALKELNMWQWIILIFAAMQLNIWDYLFRNTVDSILGREIYDYFCFPYIYIFLLGAFIYNCRAKIIPLITKRKMLILFLIVFIFWYVIYAELKIIPEFGKSYNPITSFVIAFLLIGIAYTFTINIKNDISYGIYIWHMILINIGKLWGFQGYSFMISVWGGTCLLAVLSCKLIEQPLLKRKEKIYGIFKKICCS